MRFYEEVQFKDAVLCYCRTEDVLAVTHRAGTRILNLEGLRTILFVKIVQNAERMTARDGAVCVAVRQFNGIIEVGGDLARIQCRDGRADILDQTVYLLIG